MASTTHTQRDQMPPVTLPALDGEPVDLEAYRGRKLIVFMWASW